MARHTLKFSADKVDTMIVQAIGLLDDIDKELNTYAMRVREWFGWHFPEMGKIVTDHVQYAKVIKTMGMRTKCAHTELSTILDDETEHELQEAAMVSMGTEISDEDLTNIRQLCDQVIDMSAYRTQLYEYLQNRMRAVAPNLTTMVGELVGARLIAHAGSLINLAKHPASTVQILGAEKALFRALKTKHETPKYGLIYHASLIGQAAPKHKGKISRVLAAKCALSCRVDALTVGEVPMVGIEHRAKVEARLRQLEGHAGASIGSATKNKGGHIKKYDHKKEAGGSGLERSHASYQDGADVALHGSAKKSKTENGDVSSEKKKKKAAVESSSDADASADEGKKKKKKSSKGDESEDDKKKKKKSSKSHDAESDSDAAAAAKKRKKTKEVSESSGDEAAHAKKKKDKKGKH